MPVRKVSFEEWRLLVEEGRKARHSFSQPDLIIAATALDHGFTVVSRDVRDYRKARVPMFNPWLDKLTRFQTLIGEEAHRAVSNHEASD